MRIKIGVAARAAAAALLLGGVLAAVAAATPSRPALKVVSYHGYRLTVPRGWPVYNLAAHPEVCVRFNRHAVYLGAPGPEERCPAAAIGRTEAILVQVAPGRSGAARAAASQAQPIPALIGAGGGTSGWLVDRSSGVLVAASWQSRPGLITRALGLRSLDPLLHQAGALPPGVPDPPASGTARASRTAGASRRAAAAPGGVFTGPGFDACATPSSAAMSHWISTYQAVGVYIGGTNEASCAGKGLTRRWVSRQSAAGWHVFPIYVGRQAPSNHCNCTGISPSAAGSEGRSAARDAVAQARALGFGQGNPIYADMEGYDRGSTNTSAVLKFLAAWTVQLHNSVYVSGVYSSGDSGIVDLVSRAATGYPEPDELWVARWNLQDNTNDPNVPSGDWPSHQRLHQNEGDHNETHGGVTINIDGDYLDGATAAAGTAPGMTLAPAATLPPLISGTPLAGHRLTLWHALWSGVPTDYTDQWEDCDSTGANCNRIPGATGQRYVVRASDVGHRIRVVETAVNPYGLGTPVTSYPTAAVLNSVPLYWLRNASGNVWPSAGTPFYGSPFAQGYRGKGITGAAATSDGRGYWLVSAVGRVFHFGDAAALPAVRHAHRIRGIVAAPSGGYWLYTRQGNVYPSAGATSYGSPRSAGMRGSSIKGMAATSDGQGYWLVTGAGQVFNFGDAAALPAVPHSHRIRGIVAAPSGGCWLYTRQGNVYPSAGVKWYGSPVSAGLHGARVTGLVASPSGRGYWVVTSAGTVYAYGDAFHVSPLGQAHRVTGIFR